MFKIYVLLAIFTSSFSATYAQHVYVPDSSTAIKIAEAVWLPIYGQSIYKEKPYRAKLVGDSVWVVQGSKAQSGWDTVNGHAVLTIISGGVLNVEIRRTDGKIISVIHGK